jgi:hypothetical protein
LLLLNSFTTLEGVPDPIKLPRINVVSPLEYVESHFARSVKDRFGASMYFCCPLDPSDSGYSEDALACKVLQALGESVKARAGGGKYRQESARIRQRLDDQRRRALEPLGDSGPNADLDTRRAMMFLGGVAVLWGIVVETSGLHPAWSVPVFLIIIVLFIVVLFQEKLEGNQVVDLLMTILSKIPMVGGGPPSPPELGSGDGEQEDPPNEPE